MSRSARLLALLVVLFPYRPLPAQDTSSAVLLVTLDGLRWEEVFGGADSGILARVTEDREGLTRQWWTPPREERRERLMPFLSGTVVRQGQAFGDRTAGSRVRIGNGRYFSYPGYNELLSGHPDDRIDSNARKVNPNLTVLEWLASQPGFRGRVGASTSWDVFPWILAAGRAGYPVSTGPAPGETGRLQDLLPALWPATRLDAITHLEALRLIDSMRPRVFYVAYGETDEWAHAGEYARYLDAAHRSDAMVRELWEALAARYPGRLTLVVAADHGRGGVEGWSDHGRDVPGAEWDWIMVMGPDIPAGGIREGEFSLSQVATTVARAVGQDYGAAEPAAAAPLPVR